MTELCAWLASISAACARKPALELLRMIDEEGMAMELGAMAEVAPPLAPGATPAPGVRG